MRRVLTTPLREIPNVAPTLRDTPTTDEFMHALDALARLVVYDFAVVDVLALRSVGVEDTLSPELIRTVEVPSDVYSEISKQIDRSPVGTLSSAPNPYWESIVKNSNWDVVWWEGEEKDYHDRLYEEMSTGFANSHNSPQRAFFYLELSRRAKVTVFVSKTKQDILDSLGESLAKVFDTLQQRVDNAIGGGVREVLGDATKAFSVEAPPLNEYIWRNAHDKDISLLESAFELHESADARGFREWLADIERKLRTGRRPEEIEAAKKVKDLQEQANQWATNLNLKLGTEYKEGTVRVKAIPGIGWLFDLLDHGEFKTKDFYLTPPPRYVSFVANWYKTAA